MQADIGGIKTDIAELKSGQANLEAGQANLEARQAELEAGQAKLENTLKSEFQRIADMLADIHEIIGAYRNETNKKLDNLNEETNALKRLTTRNIFDIAKLQGKIEEPAEA